ncbi:MAG: type II toxin-antitoxin system RelE/ParE family toxin [Caulobacter sp.]|nr:type II toxin-antitoxin system RelE/ParE family toxin [Caulobacter sp.]
MKAHDVLFGPLAEEDLEQLADYIAERASPARALDYVVRVRAACEQLRHFPFVGRRGMKSGLARGRSGSSAGSRSSSRSMRKRS